MTEKNAGSIDYLFLATDYPPQPGGRADFIDNLARGLIKAGTTTKVLAIVPRGRDEQIGFLRRYEKWVIPFEITYDVRPDSWSGNVATSLLEMTRSLSPLSRRVLKRCRFFRASSDSLLRFEQILASELPSMVIFGHLDMRLCPYALHLRDRGIPYGVVVHGLEVPRNLKRLNDFVRRRAFLAGASWIAPNSRYTKSLVDRWNLPSDRIRILHPPIAEEAIAFSEKIKPPRNLDGALRLATLCRLESGKGVDTVLSALNILSACGVPFHYTIGGDGREKESLERLAGDLGLRDKVFFLGYLNGNEKWKILQNIDLFVMPSRSEPTWVESFGIAFMEAAAFGIPAIASNEGGISDAVVDGETGVLIPSNSPQRLADTLKWMYYHPERRLEMGRAAQIRARQFAPAAIASKMLQDISELNARSHSAQLRFKHR